jgi:hypothetical protein
MEHRALTFKATLQIKSEIFESVNDKKSGHKFNVKIELRKENTLSDV